MSYANELMPKQLAQLTGAEYTGRKIYSLGEVDKEWMHYLQLNRQPNFKYPFLHLQPYSKTNPDSDMALERAKIKEAKKFDYLPHAEEEFQKASSWEELENTRQNLIYQEPGLRNVAPVIELGFGLGGMAIRSSKAFSDKVVDKWNKFRTPDEVYTGGPIGLKTLRTPYDVAKADARLSPPTSSYEGFQAGSYSAANLDEAKAYAMAARHAADVKGSKLDRAGEGPGPRSMAETAKIARLKTGSGVYKIDMSDTTKIYNFKYPSKYMKNEINKEIKLLQSQGKPTGHLYRLLRRDEEAAYHISHAQREFLERYGYKAWRHKESNVSTKSFVVFRPEQYKIKELSEDILTGPRRLLAEKKKKEDLGTMAFQKIIKKGPK